jgi:hypothetical protein
MLIRPPVVREMRQNLWDKIVPAPNSPTSSQPRPSGQVEQSAVDVRLAQLRDLGELRASNVLTEDEFLSEKAKILG